MRLKRRRKKYTYEKGYWKGKLISHMETGYILNAIQYLHEQKNTLEFRKQKTKEMQDELNSRDLKKGIFKYLDKHNWKLSNYKRQNKLSERFLDIAVMLTKQYPHEVNAKLSEYAYKWIELSHEIYEAGNTGKFVIKKVEHNEAYDNLDLQYYESIVDYL